MTRILRACLLALVTALVAATVAAVPTSAHAGELATADPSTGVPASDAPAEVIVIGDSLTWRGADDLRALRPSWTIDGVPGRNVFRLLPELREHLRTQRRPDAVVIALGTNTASSWQLRHYRAAAAAVPRGADVVFVSPYRNPRAARSVSQRTQAIRTETYTRWMYQLTAERRGQRCLANWASLVAHRPWMLSDGIHQTRASEKTWAKLVANSVDRCAAQG